MKKLFSICSVILLIATLCGGCASIVSKTNYPVAVSSSPEGVNITVIDQNGREVYKGQTPTTLTLNSKKGFFSGASYRVVFEKDGYSTSEITLEKQLDGWYFGNILFGGLIGMLIVDPATGAMWKLPEHCSAVLKPNVSALNLDGQNVKIVYLQDVPRDMMGEMAPLN